MSSPRVFSLRPLLLAVLLLAGCDTVPSKNPPRELVNDQKEIDANKAQLQQIADQINGLKTQIVDANKVTIDALKSQKDVAAGKVYAAQQANTQNPAPNEFTAAVASELGVAQVALGGPGSASLEKANNELKGLLGKSQLERDQAKADLENQKQELVKIQDKLTTSEQKAAAAGTDLIHAQDNATVVQGKLVESEDKYRKAAVEWGNKWKDAYAKLEANQKLRGQLEFYFYLACAATAIGAVLAFRFYPPVCLPLLAAAGGFFVAAYLVATLPFWVELLILLGVAAAFVWAFYIKHQRLAQIADNAIGATQELKNSAIDGDPNALAAYAELRKHLVDWFGERGHDLESELENRLQKLNLIGKTPQPSLLPRIRALRRQTAPAATPPAPPAAPAVTPS